MAVFQDGKTRFSNALRDNTKKIVLTTATDSPSFEVATTSSSFDVTNGVLGLDSSLNFTVDNITQSTTFTKIILEDEQEDPQNPGQFFVLPLIEIDLDDPVEFTVDGIFTLNTISVDYN